MIVITRRDLGKDPHEVGLLDLLASRVAGEIERLHAERDLQRSQEQLQAIQRVEAIGTLAGHIAHDFNNLLTIVIGYGEVLQERTPSQEVSELLAAAKRASTLTRQLLAFGRRQMMQVQRVDLNKVVMQVQAMLTGAMGTQIRLSTTLEPRLPQVEVDPGQLEQVLVNLAINARDAMPDGGTLHIDTSAVDVSRPYFQMPSRTLRPAVGQRHGHGHVARGARAHLRAVLHDERQQGNRARPVERLRHREAERRLHLVRQLTRPGRDVHDLSAPRSPCGESRDAPTVREPETARGGDERVLVVDDEPGVRKLLARILRGQGYDVFETEDGASALALLNSTNRQMDLVVTDLVMPKMSGTRLAEEIQTRWPAVKLLFVSGFPRGDSRQASALVANVPVLHKPFTSHQIEKTVRDVLDA